jgi:hypothetical protein
METGAASKMCLLFSTFVFVGPDVVKVQKSSISESERLLKSFPSEFFFFSFFQ